MKKFIESDLFMAIGVALMVAWVLMLGFYLEGRT